MVRAMKRSKVSTPAKKKAAPRGLKKTTLKKAKALKPPKSLPEKPVVVDEYGASGGMPFSSRPMPAVDRSSAHSSAQELTWATFDRQVQALARDAQKRFKPQAVVGLAHGGVFVGGAIASALKVEFYPVRITRRSRDTGARNARVKDDMPPELKGRRVLIVDDIASSGDSLEMASRLARTAGASRLATAALVSRPGGFEPDFTANTSSDFYVFPWDYSDVIDDARFDPDTAGA
jgi:hypothetical protein